MSKDKLPIFSYSKISAFKNCSRKFDYIYNKKFPKKGNKFSVRGTMIHDMIEAYIKNINYDLSYGDRYSDISEEEFNECKNEFKSIKNRELITNMKLLYDKFPDGFETEKKLEYFTDVFKFVGLIDTFIINKKGNKCSIIDYKTGKPYEDFTQLKYYALSMSYLIPNIENFLLVLSFVFHDEEKHLSLTKKDLKKIEKDLNLSITKILNTKKYKKNITSLCDYCEYLPECKKNDMIDIVVSDILEAKMVFPSNIEGPLVIDGYINSNITIINDIFTNKDIENKKITLSSYYNFKNALYDNEININLFSILNSNYFNYSDDTKVEDELKNMTLKQFHRLLILLDSKYYIVLGEHSYKSITEQNDFDKIKNSKVIFKNKILYVFDNDTNFMSYDIKVMLEEIKSLL